MGVLAHLRAGPNDPARGPQLFSTLAASIGAMAVGTIIGYASPATYQLRQNTNDTASAVYIDDYSSTRGSCTNEDCTTTIYGVPFSLDTVHLSWFSSAFSIGAVLGGLLANTMLHVLGRKGTMIATSLIALLGWLFIGLGSNFSMLVIGRMVTGVYAGTSCVSVNTYIAETASKEIRGILGSSFAFMLPLGIVYAYSFGWFCTWYTLALVCIVPPLLSAILMLFNVESPAHLLAKGKENEAYQALQVLRGPDYDISSEFKDLHQSQIENSVPLEWSHLKQSFIYKPLGIVLLLMCFQQICGINALVFNMATIFESSGSNMSESGSSVLSAAVQCGAALLAPIFIETAGRRILLVLSAFVMGFSQGCIGLFFYLQEHEEEWTNKNLSWLPLVAVMLFMVAFSPGMASVPWVMMGEMFPPNIREPASSLASAVNWMTSFVVIYSFEPLQSVMPSYGFYWLFSGLCVMSGVVCLLVVKETKGKSLHEINEMFQPHKISPIVVPVTPTVPLSNASLQDCDS